MQLSCERTDVHDVLENCKPRAERLDVAQKHIKLPAGRLKIWQRANHEPKQQHQNTATNTV